MSFGIRPRYPDVRVKLSGTEGDIFSILGKVQAALDLAGHGDAVSEFENDVCASGSFPEALQRVMRWVNVS